MSVFEGVKVIGFDADDTLWVNETLFREVESKFFKLLEGYEVEHRTSQELFKTEMQNLDYYGYGIKGFMLSMIETAIRITSWKIPNESIAEILRLGKEMMEAPVEILPSVKESLQELKQAFRLIMVTKGDLSDQERKLSKSKLEKYFHHIEIVSQKKEENYRKLLQHLDIDPSAFLMVGNSLKSDILPVVNIGARAIHIPYHVTWEHENVEETDLENKDYITLESIHALKEMYSRWKSG